MTLKVEPVCTNDINFTNSEQNGTEFDKNITCKPGKTIKSINIENFNLTIEDLPDNIKPIYSNENISKYNNDNNLTYSNNLNDSTLTEDDIKYFEWLVSKGLLDKSILEKAKQEPIYKKLEKFESTNK